MQKLIDWARWKPLLYWLLYLLFNKTPDVLVLKCPFLSFFHHLHVCTLSSLPTCFFKKHKHAATSAQLSSSLLTSLSILFLCSQPLLPPGCVLPCRVSTVTSRIWSTVSVSSRSSWIIKQHFPYCSSHISQQITTCIFKLIGFDDWGGHCLHDHWEE